MGLVLFDFKCRVVFYLFFDRSMEVFMLEFLCFVINLLKSKRWVSGFGIGGFFKIRDVCFGFLRRFL